MEKTVSGADLASARKSINNALKNLYMSRVLLSKQSPDWPIRIRRMESELFSILEEIEFKESGCKVSSWWTQR